MSLTQYQRKQDLQKTPDSSGGKGRSDINGKRRFVVRHHKATSLHYDSRLKIDGVLKSWAVPKSPSKNPADKRLAMMVEDDPLYYGNFEGTIPEGNYGAGIVEIWDKGTYDPLNHKHGADPEKQLREDLKQGNLKFLLHGKKLKGKFALVKIKGAKQENAWLLIKQNDHYATDNAYSSEQETDPHSPINQAMTQKQSKARNSKTIKTNKTKAPAPPERYAQYIQPMLSQTTNEPFSSPEWIFEIKWGGYWAIAETGKKAVKLYSRNGFSSVSKCPILTETLQAIKIPAVLDGEIVVLNEDGKADFQRLQDYANHGQDLYYYVFDLLFLKGEDLRSNPLLQGKALLKQLLKDQSIVRYCDHIVDEGAVFFFAAKKQNLEGIIAKKADSTYRSGKRTNRWLKIKNQRSIEAVIGGYTQLRGNRKHFGTLLLGLFKRKKLQYIGHTGTSFNVRQLKQIFEKIQPLVGTLSPFENNVPVNNPTTWVKPHLTCTIQYTERTRAGTLRHPVFLDLLEDKTAAELQWDIEIKTVHHHRAKQNKKGKINGNRKENQTTWEAPAVNQFD